MATWMTDPLPIVLIPGLLCSPRLYGEQLPELWRFGPIVVADHTRDDRAAEIANGIPGARLVSVPECGHLSTLERPQPVTQALVEWLET